MAFRTTSSSTAVSWEEVMEWSKNLAAKIKAGPDAEDIIPAWLVAKHLGIGILPGHADLQAKYLAFHVDNSVFCDICFVNYKEDADHQMLSIAKHSTIEEIYVEQEEKKTYQYPWYNI